MGVGVAISRAVCTCPTARPRAREPTWPGWSLGRDWAGRPVGFAWAAPAKSGIYPGSLASVVEAEPGTSPMAPVRATTTQETQPLQGFSCGPRLGERHQTVSKPPKAPGNRARRKPGICGAFIGAPGFEPGTSPTRIMGELRRRRTKCLQIGWFRRELTSSQNLGCSGRLPGFRQ
jgi:hypothetical protein